ncbi:MAG: 2-phospho-L-lactate transferase [Candidatus Dadabacteria bacterium]|nr:2-phospho-L-lactate transferase [Candidatus Dadabacteria bacterium]MCY4262072.1 2-phospho-L-lactate transferase [Candidatus Dadabacteria bacterium]
MITALGGGSGAAKFLKGLLGIISPEELSVIVNTADDMDIYGMRVSPDIDTIIYRLSGIIDEKKGWGVQGDTFEFLGAAARFGFPTWFGLGDRDLATHLFRKAVIDAGGTLSESTSKIARRFGLGEVRILPMSDDRVETWIETDAGEMHFQEYYIKWAMRPEVHGVKIKGTERASAAPFVLESIERANIVIICPSNPIISIGPILKIREVRNRLVDASGLKVAISPLMRGKPLKGPADKLMRGLGMDASSTQVARLYADFLDLLVIDRSDAGEKASIEALGVSVLVTDTIIPDEQSSARLSREILDFVESIKQKRPHTSH